MSTARRSALPVLLAAALASGGVGFAADGQLPETTAAAAAEAAAELDYSLLTINGEPVGYQTDASYDDGGRLVVDDVSRMEMSRFGQTFSMLTTLSETDAADGRLDRFELTVENNGQTMQRIAGVREGDTLRVTQVVGGQTKSREIALPADVLGPATVSTRMDEAEPLAKGESKTFRTFSPETLEVVEITFTGLGPQTTQTRGGGAVEAAAAVAMKRSDLPLESTTYFDGDGEAIRNDLGMLNLVAWPSTREEAVASLGTGDVDFGLATVVAVPPMPGLETAKSATLIVDGLKATLPSGITQKIEPIADSAAVQATVRRVDVRLFPGVGAADDAATAPSRLIDYDAAAVQALLDDAPTLGDSAGQTAFELERYVRRVVARASFGYGFGSASDTAKAKSGDCSECAVLLAALLRARDIPARVAYGLVYTDGMSAFVPHMWTEARLKTPKGTDVWVPLDATRARAGIAPTHLCFGQSTLESDAPLALKELVELSNSLGSMTIRRKADAD